VSKVDGTSELSERIELLKIAREVLVSPKLHPELIAALDLGNYTPEVHTQVKRKKKKKIKKKKT